jgi:DNA-binding NarL/FixJ family response regulator
MLAINQANISKLDIGPGRSEHSQAERQGSIKILVVDSHFLIREALRSVITELKNNATIVEAGDGYQAMRLVSEQPDIGVVLLELNLPDQDGFSVLSEMRERHPAMSVVVVSTRQDSDSVARALNLGAAGFIPKSEPRKLTLSALGLIFAGGVYIPHEILERKESSPLKLKLTCGTAGTIPSKPADIGLTRRQTDVLELMMKGKSNKAICRVLNLAEPTVKNHVTAILKAFKVTNRTEAVIAGGELGWVLS